MNQIERFFAQGFSDQIKVMGSPCVLVSKGKRTNFKAVVIQKMGDTEVELSGALYVVTGAALIPSTFTIKELVSNILECDGSRYIIVSAVKDPFNDFWSCDLTRID